MDQAHRDLLYLLGELSVERGSFVLSSGKTSDIYVDCRQTLLNPEGMALVGVVLVDLWAKTGWEIDAVAGPSVGADPMVCSFVLQARKRGHNVPGILVDKDGKVYAAGGIPSDARVLVLEDVYTTGGSVIRAIDKLREAYYDPVGALVLLDRLEEEALDLKAVRGVQMRSVFTHHDL